MTSLVIMCPVVRFLVLARRVVIVVPRVSPVILRVVVDTRPTVAVIRLALRCRCLTVRLECRVRLEIRPISLASREATLATRCISLRTPLMKWPNELVSRLSLLLSATARC